MTNWVKDYKKYFLARPGELLELLLLENYTYREIGEYFQEAILYRLQRAGMLKNNFVIKDRRANPKIKSLVCDILNEYEDDYLFVGDIIRILKEDKMLELDRSPQYLYSLIRQEPENRSALWERNENGTYRIKERKIVRK